jgi:uncharacterized lipoprotein YddW (UPF0748 family)
VAAPIKELFHNEDCTNLFYFHQIPAGKAGELIDHYVDVMARAGVTTFLCNTNARRTNYRSRVWESFWDGYDPAGADDQPFLAAIPRADVRAYRNLIGNMLAVHRQGIDYPARVIQRCRHDAISPWITLRMNDRHYTETPDHPFHGSFWKKNPQLCRKNCPGSYALCLDYAHQEVRDYYRALVVETLDRYDIDGLELDFMREPYLFSAGKEAEGTPILTGWIRQVRKLVEETAAKRGHPIRLGVRVPSRPETALGMGLDAITWAKEGLIDLLVVTPRWATLEFDMPLGHWRQLLGSARVTLAGGLEILCRPAGEPPVVATPELATGAAVSVLSEGADAVYLFNHFQDGCPGWPLPVYLKTLKAMTSLDDLLKQPRCVAITYRDVTAPGEDYRPPLPATGKEMAFSLKLGPIPDKDWGCELRIGLTPQPTAPAPTVLVNGKPCKVLKEWTAADGLRWISFVVPMTALKDAGAQLVTVVSADHKELTVRQVQMCLRPANAAVAAAPVKQLLHNEDETNIFYFNRIPPGKAGEFIDHYVDVMAQAGVTTFLCNTNARRTNYRSRVWDAYWDGYDPAGPDNQPFLAPVPKNDLPGYRKLIDGMLDVHRQGIDYPARVVTRCRHDGMSPWITLRMNDCHLNDMPTHPFHGSFWRKNPQFARQNCTGYFATCLDYAHPEVRDFYKSLIVETLDRYDIDGLELDFMREPYLFSAGKEAEGRPILTAWLREMRGLVTDAAAKRGHPIRLGVRVPSRPETAFGMGLDAVAWAKTGLIDLLVVTPRWATLEYDMPLKEWRHLLAGSKVVLAGGLEIICRPAGESPIQATPELATGAALSVLANGADAVYLFNYFQDTTWPLPIYQQTLKDMASLDTLVPRPRAVQITFRDVTAPGEDYHPLVPATGKELVFPMKLGPLPNAPRRCELLIGLAPSAAAPVASVNGKPCEVCHDTVKEGVRLVSYTVPMAALAGIETHQIKVSSKDHNALTIQQVEMSLKKE